MFMMSCLQTSFPSIPLGAEQPVRVEIINDSETDDDVDVAVSIRLGYVVTHTARFPFRFRLALICQQNTVNTSAGTLLDVHSLAETKLQASCIYMRLGRVFLVGHI